MKLGLEISSELPIHIKAGNYIETYIIVAGEKIIESHGFDEFNYPLTVIPGHILAATGRQHKYYLNNPDHNYSIFDAQPMQKIKLPESPAVTKLSLLIKTDLYHNNRSLPYSFVINLLTDSQKQIFALSNIRSAIETTDHRTTFIIDLTPLTKFAPIPTLQKLKQQ